MPRHNKTPKLERKTYSPQSCAHKRRFSTQALAQRQAELQMLQDTKLQLDTYHCHCGGWHLTSTRSQSLAD